LLHGAAFTFVAGFWNLAVVVAAIVSLDGNDLVSFWCLWVWVAFLDGASDFTKCVTGAEVTGVTGLVPSLTIASALTHLINTRWRISNVNSQAGAGGGLRTSISTAL
jgi:hypothetical protein